MQIMEKTMHLSQRRPRHVDNIKGTREKKGKAVPATGRGVR
jgi:hypothetical protein